MESLDVSDVRMEEGSLRCDANISMRPVGTEAFGTKVEIKNMNSIRSLERALHFEIARQTKALEAGEPIAQETRHWDEDSGATKSMRSKEEAFDYRYFPEPDIPAIEPSEPSGSRRSAPALPELPRARRDRYATEHGLKPEVARVLVGDRASSALFDETVALGADPEAAANWITQDLAGSLNKHGVEPAASPVTPQHIADLIALVADDTVSGAGAKQALEEAVEPPATPSPRSSSARVSARSPTPARSGAIVDEVLAENAEVVEQFRGGKEGVIGFLVGQVMKESGGSANPKLAQELLRERLCRAERARSRCAPRRSRPQRVPFWQLALLRRRRAWSAARSIPFQRMWRSTDPLDTYALCHFTSRGRRRDAGGRARRLGVLLAAGRARRSCKVAAYLALTMLPLALAGPLLVPLLDRAGPRRAISFGAAAGRARRRDLRRAAVRHAAAVPARACPAGAVEGARDHEERPHDGLRPARGRPDAGERPARPPRRDRRRRSPRPFAFVFLKVWGSAGPIYLAAGRLRRIRPLLNLRLPHPRTQPASAPDAVGPRGRIPRSRGARGRRRRHARRERVPALPAGVLAAGRAARPRTGSRCWRRAGVVGTFVADVVAPRVPTTTREEAVVIACVSAACIGALLAFEIFGLPLLTIYAFVAGAATEFGRLAFQSLMQRHAPEGAQGRVFVRYEVLFQLAWVAGAFVPALLPIDFRQGHLDPGGALRPAGDRVAGTARGCGPGNVARGEETARILSPA